jgi:heme oxygenase
MTAVPKPATKNTSDKLIEQLEAYAIDAANQIRSNLEKMDREEYMNFLDVMYHYTKGSWEKLTKIASVSHNEELKEYFQHMAKEERGHYILAQEDLRELGREVSSEECKEVTEFNTDWYNLAEKGVYGYLGALYVFENVAKHLPQEGKAMLARLNLKKTQARWISVHLEADLEHGQEIAEICTKYAADNPQG